MTVSLTLKAHSSAAWQTIKTDGVFIEIGSSPNLNFLENLNLENKNQYIITSVCFKLTKKNHKVSTTYGAIETELQHQNIQNPTLKDVSNAVIAIRQSKLPDPKELGNSGSFFKNPIKSLITSTPG